MVAPAPPASADPFVNKRGVLLVVSIGVFMATLDGSIVNLALPTMARDFLVDATAVEAVVTSYLIAIAATLLFFGAIGDRVGRKPLYVLGVGLFTVGSLFCAVAWSLPALILFRVVQALGGAMTFALGPAILTAAFPPRERGAALGAIGTAVAGGQTAGPVIGGVLLQFFGWPAIFLVNLPVGIAAVVLSRQVLSHTAPEARNFDADGRPHPFDVGGSVVLPAALIFLMLVFEVAPRAGPLSPFTLALAAGAALLVLVFRTIERRAPAPLVPLEALRNRQFISTNASAVLSFVTIGAVFFLMPFYLSGVLRYEAYWMGLVLLPVPLMIALVAPISGRLSDRIGSRIPCVVGLSIATVATLALSTLSRGSNEIDVVWRLALFGLGMALFQSPNNSAIMGSVERRFLGMASGMMATMRTLGFAVGVALGAGLLAAAYAAATGGIPLPPGNTVPDADAFVQGQSIALLVIAAVCAAGVVTSLVRGAKRVVEPQAPKEAAAQGGLP